MDPTYFLISSSRQRSEQLVSKKMNCVKIDNEEDVMSLVREFSFSCSIESLWRSEGQRLLRGSQLLGGWGDLLIHTHSVERTLFCQTIEMMGEREKCHRENERMRDIWRRSLARFGRSFRLVESRSKKHNDRSCLGWKIRIMCGKEGWWIGHIDCVCTFGKEQFENVCLVC